MQIEIIETGQRLSESDWYARNPTIAFPRPLTDQVLQEAHDSFPTIPLARIVPPEPQPEPTPQIITRAQGKAALIQAGLWDAVLAHVAGIADPTERALAEVALHDTLEWRRSSPFLNAAAAALGLDDNALDALFAVAASVEL